MPATVTELATYVGNPTPGIILADPDTFGFDSIYWDIPLTFGAAVPAGAAVFIVVGEHSGGDAASLSLTYANNNRYRITDPATQLYARQGDASPTSDGPGAVTWMVPSSVALSSGASINIRRKRAKTLGYHPTTYDQPFTVQAFMVEGLTFPDPVTTPASFGGASSNGSTSPPVTITNSVTPSASKRIFAWALTSYEPKSGDSWSETLNGFSPVGTSVLLTSAGGLDTGDHYKDQGMRVRYRDVPLSSGSYGTSLVQTSSQSTVQWATGAFYAIVKDIFSGEVAHCVDAPGTSEWLLISDGTNLALEEWQLNSAGKWAKANSNALFAGISPSIFAHPDGSLDLAWVDSGSAKRCVYSPGAGTGASMTIGTATLVSHCIDAHGRMIAACYDTAWKVLVGTLGSDGKTWTFSAAVSMGLTADAAKGTLEPQPDGSVLFSYVNAGVAQLVRGAPADDGTGGGWS